MDILPFHLEVYSDGDSRNSLIMDVDMYDEVDMGVDPNLKLPLEEDSKQIEAEDAVKDNDALDR